MNSSLKETKLFIPFEFKRKMRPMSELAYWKASEFRLFLLYAGVVVLKNRDLLDKCYYRHFVKLASALRLLLISDSTDDDISLCSKFLIEFCEECSSLYGRGFLSYNVHGLIHLVHDFKLFGSLDFVSCFSFESFLGLLKSRVSSGHKPFEQIAYYAWHENANIVESSRLKNEKYESNRFYSITENGIKLPIFQDIPVTHYKKANLSSGCLIDTACDSDSYIRFNDNIGKVCDMIECGSCKYLVVRKCLNVKDLFKQPIPSSRVGIFLVDGLCECFEVIDFESDVSKCMLLPHKSKFIALELIHSIV